MKIAIDFDDTLTADHKLWAVFLNAARMQGHEVWLVTARRETEENVRDIEAWLEEWGHSLPVLFTNLRSKLRTAEQQGLRFDIWIDDDPRSLVNGH